MSFLPAMTAEISGFQALEPLRYRRLELGVADLWHVAAREGAEGHYLSPHARLVLFVDAPQDCVALTTPCGQHVGAGAFFIPAGMPLQLRMTRAARLAHVDLHFDAARLARHLNGEIPAERLARPHFAPPDAQWRDLARLLAQAIAAPQSSRLVIEGLVSAALGLCFGGEAPAEPRRGGLTDRQIGALEQLVAADPARPITVAQMAQTAGLSPSWFAHAFKTSLKVSPHHWLMRRRLEAAMRLMQGDAELPLAEIAAGTGFADQAHFSRAFKAAYRCPPGAWRRENAGRRTIAAG